MSEMSDYWDIWMLCEVNGCRKLATGKGDQVCTEHEEKKEEA